MAEKWTNTSALPSSGAMKPKPLLELNHFTVPVAIDLVPCLCPTASIRREPSGTSTALANAIGGSKSPIGYPVLPGTATRTPQSRYRLLPWCRSRVRRAHIALLPDPALRRRHHLADALPPRRAAIRLTPHRSCTCPSPPASLT